MKYGYEFKGYDEHLESEIKPQKGGVLPSILNIMELAVQKIPISILTREIQRRAELKK